MVLLFENFHMSDSMLDPSAVKMKNKRPGSPGPQWGQASSFSVDMHTPLCLQDLCLKVGECPYLLRQYWVPKVLMKRQELWFCFSCWLMLPPSSPGGLGVAMEYFLHSAGCGHKGTDRGRAKRPESTGLAQLAAVAPYPTSFCCPGSWEKFGFGGD